MSTKEAGTFVPSALDSPHDLPTLPPSGSPPQDNLLYCQQMLSRANEQLRRFMSFHGLDPIEVQQLQGIINDISFYNNTSDTWRTIISVQEGQNDA
jgi:hypothetical protein